MSEKLAPAKPASDAPSSPLKGKGPLKGKIAPAAKRIGGKMRLKAKVAKAAPEKRSARPPAAEERFPDQTGLRTTPSPGEGYVRLRIHVDEVGEASVVASHFVRSTLVQPSMLQGNYAYEVTEGENRLHLDSIPDLGVFRSFVNPDGPLEEHKHHMYELKSYDYDVRVPAEILVAAKLSNIVIKLYRVKVARATMPAGCLPLDVQYERELREVTRIEGIPVKILPDTVQKEIGRRKR
jgi:hypothetical protein